MNDGRKASAVEVLVAARREARVLSRLPADVTPADHDEAYAIQDAFRAAWPDRVVGWKAGATAAAVQAKFGVREPFAGPMFAGDVSQSPARLPARRFPHLCLESEFAFRFGRALPPRATPYGADEIAEAVDALVPAFEIVGPRFDTLLFGQAPTAIADCALNAAFVLGAPVTAWRGHDLAAHRVTLRVDGAVRAEGTGANVLGHPLVALAWIVTHLGRRGITIEPGHVLSTGTTTGLTYIEPEQTAVADFGVFGSVEMRFIGEKNPQSVMPV